MLSASVTVRRISWSKRCPTSNCSNQRPAIVFSSFTTSVALRTYVDTWYTCVLYASYYILQSAFFLDGDLAMSLSMNLQVRLKSRPVGIPQAEHFEIVEAPMPVPGPSQVLVRNHYLSVEPAMRGWVNAVGNYSEPVAVGAVMRSFAAGFVVQSHDPAWPVGTPVTGLFCWEGSAVRHFARVGDCRTVGITGGETKRRLCLERFGFDAAVDYKAASFEQRLAEACGDVDVYYDNTAGAISDAGMSRLSVGARVVVCGTASVANWDPAPQGPRVERHLLIKRARMQGFVIFDHPDHHATARAELAQWLREGKLQYVEEILDGIEHAPDAIAGLYRGENLGKRLIRLVPS